MLYLVDIDANKVLQWHCDGVPVTDLTISDTTAYILYMDNTTKIAMLNFNVHRFLNYLIAEKDWPRAIKTVKKYSVVDMPLLESMISSLKDAVVDDQLISEVQQIIDHEVSREKEAKLEEERKLRLAEEERIKQQQMKEVYNFTVQTPQPQPVHDPETDHPKMHLIDPKLSPVSESMKLEPSPNDKELSFVFDKIVESTDQPPSKLKRGKRGKRRDQVPIPRVPTPPTNSFLNLSPEKTSPLQVQIMQDTKRQMEVVKNKVTNAFTSLFSSE